MTETAYVRTLRGDGGEQVLAVSGEIDWSNAAAALARPDGGSAGPGGTVVLDLREVTYFDSAALGALFRLHGAVTAAGGTLRVVVAAGSPLPALFEISQIGQLMLVTVV